MSWGQGALSCSLLTACLLLCGLTACGDPDGDSEAGNNETPVLSGVVTRDHLGGLPLAVAGNFINDRPDDLALEFAGQPLQIRALTPSRITANVPFQATTNVLDVSRGGGKSASVNLAIEGQYPRGIVVENEPNGELDPAHRIDAFDNNDSVTILASADEATEEGYGLDRFDIRFGEVGLQSKLLVRIDQSQHSRALPYELIVSQPGGGELGRIESLDGEDLGLLLNAFTTDYEVRVQTPAGWEGERYDLEVRLIRSESTPQRAMLFDRRAAVSAPIDIGCDLPAVHDLDGDGVEDVQCDDITFDPYGVANRSDDPAPLRSRRVRWADVDANGVLDAFVVGPGPRTHRLVLRTASGWEEQTTALGLAEVTGLDLREAHLVDLDQDTRPDLIAIPTRGKPQLYRNTGQGFEPWLPWQNDPFSAGDTVIASAVYDRDHDGDIDWLVFVRSETNVVTPRGLINDGNRLRRVDLAGGALGDYANPQVLMPLYLEDDDQPDLLVVDQDGRVRIHEGVVGQGSWSLGEAVVVGEARGAQTAAIGDLNADGSVDILVTSTHGNRLWLREAGNTMLWRAASNLPRGITAAVAASQTPDGTPAAFVDGELWVATVGPFDSAIVQPRANGVPAAGALVVATFAGGERWAQIGMQGTGTADSGDNAIFYFPSPMLDPVAVTVTFASGGTSERTVTNFNSALVMEQP